MQANETTTLPQTTNTTVPTRQDAVKAAEAITDALRRGLEEAIHAYAEYIDAGGTLATLRSVAPHITPDLWSTLEDCRTGRLHLKAASYNRFERCALRGLPLAEQATAIEEGVDVLTENGDILRVQMSDLTPHQRKQVFNNTHVRTPAEQRAWVESQRSAIQIRTRPDAREGYRINRRDKVLEVVAPYKFTHSDLCDILEQMG